ncbi:hypothetical protein KCU81_g5925, partial [Aureobasidium melanogenum]|uniref:Uncharacterized protein n=1 Tax=Aureobasidium melanogenum (strain CBS 110374) TaxID=1043003 RepID=A0A074W2H8_AURM1
MACFKPFGDVVIHTIEESDDHTLTSETNQDNTVAHVKVKRESPQLPDIGFGAFRPRRSLSQMRKERTNHPLVTRLTAGQNVAYTDKLDRIKKKLEKKTVEELTDLYNGSKDSSFHKIIMEVFHEKRMATLEDWEKQIETMSKPPQPFPAHTAHIEDSDDDIEVLVFKDSGRVNNTITTPTINTNNEQSNKPSVHTRLKYLAPKPPQRPLATENKMARAGSRENIPNHHNPHTHKSSSSPTGRQSLFGGPFGDDSIGGNSNIIDMDQVIKNLLKEEPGSTTPDSLIAHSSRSTTPTQTNTVNHNTASKVSKSNPSHIALFDTLSPSQSLGRKRKLTSIRNKLKAKTCEELHEIYNSTDDPDFRKLMSEVYYENCMERLDDWERKL